jgi:pimeloyl-ACP methyl ester carboxylesterase
MTPAEMAAARVAAVLGPNPPADVRAEVESMLTEIHPSGYRVAAIALAHAETRDVLAGMSVPTLIITGEHDRIVPPSAGEWLRDRISGARLVTISGVGHLAGQERSGEYNATLCAFLTES